MTIYKDYIRITKQYQQEYGPRTVLLYQVGSFYELYSINDEFINLKDITELLNIQMTRKNKSVIEVSESNHNMAGIPTFALQKYLKQLVAANYTVVIYDQTDRGTREVAEIVSAGTKMIDLSPFETNMIMVAYFEYFSNRKTKNKLLGIGTCFLDITSGKSYVGEFISTETDQSFALDELYKYTMIHQPREIILLSAECNNAAGNNNNANPNLCADKLMAYLDIGSNQSGAGIGIGSNSFVHDRIGKLSAEMQKNNYQQELLRKVFPNHGLLTPHEYVGLESFTLASQAYVYMLDFCYKHNDRVLNNITPPTIVQDDSEYCTIAYNAANQLGLSMLAKQLNKCRTAIGRRAFRETLYTPIICPETLSAKYDRVDAFIRLLEDKQTLSIFIENMDKIYDVERLYRLLCLQKLHPADLSQITSTMEAVRALNRLSADLQFTKAGSARRIHEEITGTINLSMAQKYSLATIEENFFVMGLYPELDSLQNQLGESKNIFAQVAAAYHSEFFKVEYTERDGYYLTITKKRYDSIKTALLKMSPLVIGDFQCQWSDFEIKPNATILKCIAPQLCKINRRIADIKMELSDIVRQTYREFIGGIADKYQKLFIKLTQYIADIDWYYSCAKCAIEYKYYRPTIKRSDMPRSESRNLQGLPHDQHTKLTDPQVNYDDPQDGLPSYLSAIQLRHPIIERILTQEEYVPNDVQLGGEFGSGILLYGVNSSGKSSLSKAVALAIIMAQVGMFVPANLTYWPYRQIFTRIPSGDDIIKGKSTFIIEISEMGNILKRATPNSLVIGDELASGTESISALSIVGAGITQLCSRKTSFIFATHLHDLTSISQVKSLIKSTELSIFHLAVEYDAGRDCLIYQRKLARGQGATIYGLEVCKALNLDTQFMNIANKIRHEVLGESADLVKQKKSRYNAAVFVDLCRVCGGKAQEVHHIKPQELADLAGYIGAVHKNHRANLIAICEKCHDAIHAGKIKVDGFRQTTAGIQLITRTATVAI